MRELIGSIQEEYQRYKRLAEGALAQMRDEELSRSNSGDDNSAAMIVAHLAGNFASRFTDFLTSDGEKPWRHREEEFAARSLGRDELLALWGQGWAVLFTTLGQLTDSQLSDEVVIRGQSLKVHEALHRSLAHASYHVGQIVFLAKGFRGSAWVSLSIPRGASDAYNQAPTLERAGDHAAKLKQGDAGPR